MGSIIIPYGAEQSDHDFVRNKRKHFTSTSSTFKFVLIHKSLLGHGFKPYNYDPFSRVLEELKYFGKNNTIYLRDLDFISSRLKSADQFEVFGELI
jgi:hypothetical protein